MNAQEVKSICTEKCADCKYRVRGLFLYFCTGDECPEDKIDWNLEHGYIDHTDEARERGE